MYAQKFCVIICYYSLISAPQFLIPVLSENFPYMKKPTVFQVILKKFFLLPFLLTAVLPLCQKNQFSTLFSFFVGFLCHFVGQLYKEPVADLKIPPQSQSNNFGNSH